MGRLPTTECTYLPTYLGYPPGHAPAAMTPTLVPTRSYVWMVTVSLCGVLPD